MKILFSLLIFAILLCPILTEKSYGQTEGTVNPKVITIAPQGTGAQIENNTKIFVQIKLYDSAGRFVAYTQGYAQTIINIDNIVKWVTSHSQKSTITKEGKSFEIFKNVDQVPWHKVTSMGGYFFSVINGTAGGVMIYAFDSFPISPGDHAKVTWTIIRPAG